MISELPSYHHLTPQQVEGLSIRVTLRCGKEGPCLSKDIAWQESVTRPSAAVDAASPEDERGICLFTYTNADVIPDTGEGLGFRFRGDDDSRGRPPRAELNDACQVFVIAAANDSAPEPHVQVLCVIKLHEGGQLSACPGFSEVEPEDDCDGRLLASDRGLDEARALGPRLTTYAFCTADGSACEYAIECNATGGDDRGERDLLAIEKHEKRRRRIRKEFEAFDCMHEDEDAQWDAHARVELVSADGFEESNPLLAAPFGSGLVVRYRVLRPSADGSEEEVVVLKGTTACVQSHSAVRGTLEFATRFTVAFVVLAFALLLWLGDSDCDLWRILLLSSVPLALTVKAAVLGDASRFHINHPFTMNSNEEQTSAHSPELVLELRAYFRHNFGVTSLAGCGIVALPSNSGTYDVTVPTWKPISCSGVSEARCRLHNYYLGSCLSEVHPLDPVPTSESEGELLKGTGATLLSKGGLTTDGSGSIQVRIDVMKNYFLRDTPPEEDSEETRQHRVKLRESVDEVLTRVRRNKRGRMARVYDAAASDDASATGGGTPERAMDRGCDETMDDKVSERTAEVLTRVRARKSA